MVSDRETGGGAAIAASRLARQLVEMGHSVQRLVRFPDPGPHPWETAVLCLDGASRLATRVLPRWLRTRWRQIAIEHRLSAMLGGERADVVNLHNLHGAVGDGWSVGLVRVCQRCAPVVWTLHDMWTFTGRCAYSWDCEKYLSGCDRSCPTPEEYPALPRGRIQPAWRARRRLLAAGAGPVGVAPSRWMRDRAVQGLWSGRRVEVIPNGLPVGVYEPIDRALARQALGLDVRHPVLLTCAEDLSERRKGGDVLKAALGRLPAATTSLVTLGRAGHPTGSGHVVNLGFVDHERTRMLAYNAADLFVHPAPVDNLPNVVLEAIACGTPVVALPVGGVPEMVRPGRTGWLAADPTAEALAEAISGALRDLAAGSSLRASCRETAVREYDAAVQARRYAALVCDLQAFWGDPGAAPA